MNDNFQVKTILSARFSSLWDLGKILFKEVETLVALKYFDSDPFFPHLKPITHLFGEIVYEFDL